LDFYWIAPFTWDRGSSLVNRIVFQHQPPASMHSQQVASIAAPPERVNGG